MPHCVVTTTRFTRFLRRQARYSGRSAGRSLTLSWAKGPSLRGSTLRDGLSRERYCHYLTTRVRPGIYLICFVAETNTPDAGNGSDITGPCASYLAMRANGDRLTSRTDARGLILDLDSKKKTAFLRKEYRPQLNVTSSSQGSAHRQPDGNFLVGWGSNPWSVPFSVLPELIEK